MLDGRVRMPEFDDSEVYEVMSVGVDTSSTPISALGHLRVRADQEAPWDDLLKCERNASTWIVGTQAWRGGRPHPDPEARRVSLYHDSGPTDLEPGDRVRILRPHGTVETEFFFGGHPVGVLVDGPPSAPGILRYRSWRHFGDAQLRMALSDSPEVGCLCDIEGGRRVFFVRLGDRPYELVATRISSLAAGPDPGDAALLHGVRQVLLRAARMIREDRITETLEADRSLSSDLDATRTICIEHLDQLESIARGLGSGRLNLALWNCITLACEMLNLWERSAELHELKNTLLLERTRRP